MSQDLTSSLAKINLAIKKWKLIDLSLPIFKEMIQYSGEPEIDIFGPYSVLPEGSVKEFCYQLKISTQTGTHIQAPHYFIENGCRISDYPVSSFRFIAHIVDLSTGHDKTIEALEELGRTYNMQNRAVVFITEYCDSLMTDTKDSGSAVKSSSRSSPNESEQPFITMELAQKLVNLSVGLVGIDSLGFEPPGSTEFEVNRLFCENEVFILEGLCRLSEIPSSVFLLEAYPLSIVGVEGSPCRAVALIPPEENRENITDV
jgi:kynurenine formamidase